MKKGKLPTVFFGYTSIFFRFFFLLCLINPLSALSAQKPLVVVLDAGHGGEDSGSVYPLRNKRVKNKKRIREKIFTLRLARKLKKSLEQQAPKILPGRLVKVVLTRNRDQFLSLDKRAEISRKAKADFFVSLHANAERTGTARGLEIYYLDNASQESYRHHETLHERQESKKPKTKENGLGLLLRSIATDGSIQSSQKAARLIEKQIRKNLKSKGIPHVNRGVRSALLQVLLDVQTPGILLEAAFLSNKQDRRLLQDRHAQTALADGGGHGPTAVFS